MERKTEDYVMRTRKMEVDGHRHIERPKLGRRDHNYKKTHEGDGSKYRRSTIPENLEIEKHDTRPQIRKTSKRKNTVISFNLLFHTALFTRRCAYLSKQETV